MAWPTSVLPSDQAAPGTRWLAAITASNALTIQSQSASVRVKAGMSLMVWLPWPETWLRILCSLNSGMVIIWQNKPLLVASIRFQEALSFSEVGGPNSTLNQGRMYTGEAPKTELNRVFGITTFELG